MTAPHFPWRDTVGPQRGVTYGYLWWVTDGPPVHAFFAWGYGGQFVYIAPDLDLVAVVATEWTGVGATAPAIADSALSVISGRGITGGAVGKSVQPRHMDVR